VQTKESGKPDILPVAAVRPDHAVVPVMLPRESDADMRRDGGTTARRSLRAVDEPGRVHGAPAPQPQDRIVIADQTLATTVV
jgi:hypothetical protein